jgi:hypothetical protein
MTRDELIQRSAELAANLHELGVHFELVQKTALDNKQPIDDITLRTFARIYQDATIRVMTLEQVTARAFALLGLHHPSVPSPSNPPKPKHPWVWPWKPLLRLIRGSKDPK